MKLYTEAEIISAYEKAELCHLRMESFMELLTPIELPSDEEIEKESKYKSRYILPPPVRFNPVLNIVYIDGAKWMRDKIGGNK